MVRVPRDGAYLAFPLLALALVRLRSAWLAYVLAVAVTVAGLVRLDQLDIHGFGFFSYQAGWTRLAMQFLTGCLLCVAWNRSGRWRRGLHWDVAGFLAAIVIVIACLAEDIRHVGFFPYAAVPCLGLVVVACAGATGPLRYVFSTRGVVWLGRVSYSLYMTHTLTLTLATLFIGWLWERHAPSDFMRGATPILVVRRGDRRRRRGVPPGRGTGAAWPAAIHRSATRHGLNDARGGSAPQRSTHVSGSMGT